MAQKKAVQQASLIILLLLISFQSIAQGFGQNNGQQTGEQRPFVEYVDTFGVFELQADNPSDIRPFQDTSLRYFHRYDPAQQPLFADANTGIVGSPTRAIFYRSRFRQGFDVGFHQYDAYYIQPEALPYYVLDKPYANLRATIGSRQEDNILNATFARKFAKGWNLTFKANSIQQQSAWKYPNQKLSERALGTGLWYKAPSGRYNGFFTLTSNITVAEEGGGLSSIPDPTTPFSSPSAATTFLSNGANTRHAHRMFGYTQYFKIRKRDSIPSNRRAFTLAHTIQYRTSTYKYTDETTPSDSLYYHSFLEDRDERGVRFFLKHRAICNTFRVGTYKTNEATANKVAGQRDRFEVGLIHRVHFLDNDIENSTINNLFVTGQFDFRPNKRLVIQTAAHLGVLGNNLGDYRASGDLSFDIGKIGQFSAKAITQAYEPSLVQQEFIVTQQAIWPSMQVAPALKKVFENNFSASYAIPSLGLTAAANLHSITNYVYFEQVSRGVDTIFQVQQADGILAIPQLSIQHQLKVGAFHLDNTFAIQPSDSTRVLRLPTWLSRHSLYVESMLFKKNLRFQLGIDLSMNAEYFADTYHPLLGQFHIQNEARIPFYPALDVFLNLKIKQARFFVKAQNLAHLLPRRGNYPNPFFNFFVELQDLGHLLPDYKYQYYQTFNYPQLPFFISWGLDWTMRD